MSLKAVLFDLDGTLLDTAADFTRVLNLQLARHGLPSVDYESVRSRVSNGARAVVQHGFGVTVDDAGFQPLLDEFLDTYEQNLADETALFPGLPDVLAEIESRGLLWGIVTNKPERFTLPLLRAIGLADRCAIAICPDHVAQRKPHPEPILLACRHLQCTPDEGIYVGDHLRDIESGAAAGMRTIACRYGYIDDNDDIGSWGADYIVSSGADLNQLLKQFF